MELEAHFFYVYKYTFGKQNKNPNEKKTSVSTKTMMWNATNKEWPVPLNQRDWLDCGTQINLIWTEPPENCDAL